MGFLVFIGFIIALPVLIVWAFDFIPRYNATQRIKKISESFVELPVREQTQSAYRRRNNSVYNARYGFTGVYILYNTSKNKYYVGQSVNVFRRINQHFTGHGNTGVYYDYLAGDKFMVKAIPLIESGYTSLNSLERDTIAAYNAYYKGYNGTRGNRG